MFLMLAGLAVLVVTGIVFWSFLPRGGTRHRFVETEWEPYIGVAFTSAVALGLTMTLSGAINMMS